MNTKKYLCPAVFPDMLLCWISWRNPTEGISVLQLLQVGLIHYTERSTQELAEGAVEWMVL